MNFPSLNYTVSSRSRTLLLVLSSELLSPAISLSSYALSTGFESLNASNTSSPLLPTKLSQLPNPTSIPPHLCSMSSQYSLFIRRYCCSAIFIILSKNNWSLLSVCFTICLWNQLLLSLRQPHSGISSDSPTTSPITSSSFVSPLSHP